MPSPRDGKRTPRTRRRQRSWRVWSAEFATVMSGALVAFGLIAGLGWGQHGGWRLLAAAAVGLAVAIVMSELPIRPIRANRTVAGEREDSDSNDS
ncbi:hypothetical protein [Streptomyces sp. NPDC048527]|uniref:hypothetical protein n=1 Tax=Streptomyces sp. NPDC048527 TaxID=3365568 RepID=UPI00371B283E